jgi:hypothetical protein
MNCFQLPGLILIIGFLFLNSCDETPHATEAGSPGDPETARIEAELSFMNFSQEVKSRNLTIGKSNDFAKMGEVPAQAKQIYERTFILSPVASNPRLFLVGKIRLEVCKDFKDSSTENSFTSQLSDSSLNPALDNQ